MLLLLPAVLLPDSSQRIVSFAVLTEKSLLYMYLIHSTRRRGVYDTAINSN